MKYRKRPVVIEATQWHKHGDHPNVITMREHYEKHQQQMFPGVAHLGVIETLEGPMTVQPGDWVITGVKGEHYACKPDIFACTYEPAEERSAHELLLEAIEILQEERDVLHTSNAVDGVVTDRDALDYIEKYDCWLRDARTATS